MISTSNEYQAMCARVCVNFTLLFIFFYPDPDLFFGDVDSSFPQHLCQSLGGELTQDWR